MKKTIISIMLVLLVSMCLFAEESNWFILQHNINVTDSCWFEYWSPSTENPLSGSVNIQSVLPTRFATLAVHYTGQNRNVSLSVGFTPLFKVDGESLDSTTVYDYTMEVLKPGDNTPLIESSSYYSSTITINGISYPMTKVDIYNRQTIGERNKTGKYAIADFRITLNSDDEMQSGTYRGYLTFYNTSP